jgi:hypothetical protein
MKLDELAFLTLGVSAILGATMSLLPSLRVCALQNATIYNCSCVCNDKFTNKTWKKPLFTLFGLSRFCDMRSQYPKNGEYGPSRDV